MLVYVFGKKADVGPSAAVEVPALQDDPVYIGERGVSVSVLVERIAWREQR